MKKTLIAIATLTLSTAALADVTISSGNEDLRGWAVEDRSLQAGGRLHEGPESGILYASEDTYGSVIFDRNKPAGMSPASVGVGDSYGSVLHSVGFDG